MFKDFDFRQLKRNPQIAFYFRYPLRHTDFHQVRMNGRLLGRVAAKPLYGRLTPEGKVDRSRGFNGQIAMVFIPAKARSPKAARLLFTRIQRRSIVLSNGRRNWQSIRKAAEQAVRQIYRHPQK